MKYLFGVTYENVPLNFINFSVCVCDRIRHFFFGFKYSKRNFFEYSSLIKCVS